MSLSFIGEFPKISWTVEEAAQEMLRRDQYFIIEKIELIMYKYLDKMIRFEGTRYYLTEPQDFFLLPLKLKFLLLADK